MLLSDLMAVSLPTLAPATSARNVIQPSSPSATALTLKGAAAQTATLRESQTSAGVVLESLSAAGQLGLSLATRPINLGATLGEKIALYESSAAARDYYGFGVESSILAYQVPLTSHSHKWYAASTALMTLTGAGQLQLPVTGSTGGIVVGGDVQLYRGSADLLYLTNDALLGEATAAATPIFYGRQVADATARFSIAGSGLHQWGPGNAARDMQISRTAAGESTWQGIGGATGTKLIVKQVAAQTVNSQEWQNSAAAVLAQIDSTGNGRFGMLSGAGMRVGDVGWGSSGYFGIAHSSTFNSTDYALMQSSSGDTYVNAKSGQPVTFRVNNVTLAQLEADGDFALPTAGKGVIVKSPDGATTKRLGIDNAGALTLTAP